MSTMHSYAYAGAFALGLSALVGSAALPSEACAQVSQEANAAIGSEYRNIGPGLQSRFYTWADYAGVLATPDGVGAFQYFTGPEGRGAIYWSQPSGANAIYGTILDKWSSLGWETGLGYPTRDRAPTTGQAGRTSTFAQFEGGEVRSRAAIVSHPDFGTYAIHGAIHALWSTLEAPLYPLEDEHDRRPNEDGTCEPGDRAQRFHNPTTKQLNVICWNAADGARVAAVSF